VRRVRAVRTDCSCDCGDLSVRERYGGPVAGVHCATSHAVHSGRTFRSRWAGLPQGKAGRGKTASCPKASGGEHDHCASIPIGGEANLDPSSAGRLSRTVTTCALVHTFPQHPYNWPTSNPGHSRPTRVPGPRRQAPRVLPLADGCVLAGSWPKANADRRAQAPARQPAVLVEPYSVDWAETRRSFTGDSQRWDGGLGL
jgi:hypothetical protein